MKTRVTIVVMMWIRESMKYQILFNNFKSLFLESSCHNRYGRRG